LVAQQNLGRLMSQHYKAIGHAHGQMLGLHMEAYIFMRQLGSSITAAAGTGGLTVRAEDLCASLEPDGLTEVDAGVL